MLGGSGDREGSRERKININIVQPGGRTWRDRTWTRRSPHLNSGPAGAGNGDSSPVRGNSGAAERCATAVAAGDAEVTARATRCASEPSTPMPASPKGCSAPLTVGAPATAGGTVEWAPPRTPAVSGRADPVSGMPGRVTGRGATPVTRSETGWTTGSRMGTASTSGGATVSTSAAVASSATTATGTATAETVPTGTALFTTGTAAINWSVAPVSVPTMGCRSPDGAAAGGEGVAAGGGADVPVSGAARAETEEVAPPRSEPESAESAVAAVPESVSQVRVAAPARRTGRSARHGNRPLAMRTTPRCR